MSHCETGRITYLVHLFKTLTNHLRDTIILVLYADNSELGFAKRERRMWVAVSTSQIWTEFL